MSGELVLATGNEHKKRELAQMVPDLRILTPRELGIDSVYEETGATYLDNAFGKALAIFRQLEAGGNPRPVIADDSGLSVVALGGAPGVHSARYGADRSGRLLDSPARNALLLQAMDGMKDRRAFYVCCMVVLFSEYRFAIAQETWEGEIALEPTGTNGFGYDPIFLLPKEGRTAAAMSETEKNTRSHRGKALRQLVPHFTGL